MHLGIEDKRLDSYLLLLSRISIPKKKDRKKIEKNTKSKKSIHIPKIQKNIFLFLFGPGEILLFYLYSFASNSTLLSPDTK